MQKKNGGTESFVVYQTQKGSSKKKESYVRENVKWRGSKLGTWSNVFPTHK